PPRRPRRPERGGPSRSCRRWPRPSPRRRPAGAPWARRWPAAGERTRVKRVSWTLLSDDGERSAFTGYNPPPVARNWREDPMKTLAVIPARGGSKSIPRKNLVDVAGRPLIAWIIAAGRAARGAPRG